MAEAHKLRIVMFPWLAFGHMIPYLELAKLIAQKGHFVFFVSTPRNIDRLPQLHPDLSTFINFVKIQLPRVDNLPENAEATSDLPYDRVQYLKKAYDQLKTPMTQFLKSSQFDWILHDFVPYWMPAIGAPLGIKTAFFSIFNPELLGFVGPPSALLGNDSRKKPEDFTVPADWVPFPTTVAFRYFEIKKIFESVSGDESGVSDVYRTGTVIENCNIVAVRGCTDFEGEWFQVLENIYQKPIFPVGQLPTTEYETGEETETWRTIKRWLDEKEKGSVVYVAFGSEAKPSQSELTEIAHGLEESELPFFWVFRSRRGESDPEPIELPEGFEERTKERGMVWKKWAPQLKILGHDAVGGFLTHSGWTSVVEAIQCNRALLLLTFLADQGINAKVLTEKKMGYCIPRNENDGSFTRKSVAESLRLVVEMEEGKIYRARVKEMRGLFMDEVRQERYVDNLLGYLSSRQICENRR